MAIIIFGQMDELTKEKNFMNLDTKSGTTRLKAPIILETAGRLKQTAGWIMFKGKARTE